jgi:hypothetical protein
LSRQNGIPESGCIGNFEVQLCEVELTFANAMHQPHSRDRDCSAPESFEAEHDFRSRLDECNDPPNRERREQLRKVAPSLAAGIRVPKWKTTWVFTGNRKV